MACSSGVPVLRRVGPVSCVLLSLVVCGSAMGADKAEVIQPTKVGVSRPLRDLVMEERGGPERDHPVKMLPMKHDGGPDAAVQGSSGPLVAAPAGGFAGMGVSGGYSPDAAPPDTNGSVGSTQYVQWVNEVIAVYDKATGAKLAGPIRGNQLWAGFGGGCQNNNDGDPIVLWDKAAGRWLMSQFSVSTTPYLQCIAISQSADATGAWYLYSYSFGTGFNDYPKFGVWPDAYYATFNIFNNGATFAGAKVCAFDRAKMLTGAAATMQCFQTSTSYGGLLPADLDGSTAPPAGSPNYVMSFGTNSLNLWKFHVDWTTPANTTFTGPTNIPVASFTRACNGGTCISQPGTSQQLDSLADRLMYRLAYRNLGGSERLVVNHSVTVGTNKKNQHAGVRWYEIRLSNGTPSVYQQGTYSPDNNHRWMGSVAMDKFGNIAMGYSKSSSSVYPAIWYTGRVPTDALGTMQAEAQLLAGGGSQLRTLSRWGDYSSISVDPVDDCTMWFTTEYLQSSGTFNWSTWISKIKMPGCQ